MIQTPTREDMPGVKLNTALKAASGGKYDLEKVCYVFSY